VTAEAILRRHFDFVSTYDPDTNITIDTAEINQRRRTSEDPILVAACFNAGGLQVKRAWASDTGAPTPKRVVWNRLLRRY
jgi:soluble lytic murein transglycosylase-like protein